MGLDLSGSKKPSRKAAAKKSKEIKQAAEDEAEKKVSTKKSSGEKKKPKLAGSKKSSKASKVDKPTKKSKSVTDVLDEDDEPIVATGETEGGSTAKSKKLVVNEIKAFEGGLVHPSLKGVLNAHWRKSAETELFLAVLETSMLVDGVSFGAISIKSSFIKRVGGSALL